MTTPASVRTKFTGTIAGSAPEWIPSRPSGRWRIIARQSSRDSTSKPLRSISMRGHRREAGVSRTGPKVPSVFDRRPCRRTSFLPFDGTMTTHQVTGARDVALVYVFVLAVVALLVSVTAIGFGLRADDESSSGAGEVSAGGTATATASLTELKIEP